MVMLESEKTIADPPARDPDTLIERLPVVAATVPTPVPPAACTPSVVPINTLPPNPPGLLASNLAVPVNELKTSPGVPEELVVVT